MSIAALLALYAHLGCIPFGARVGPPEARLQPKYLTIDTLLKRGRVISGSPRHSAAACPYRDLTSASRVQFMPGACTSMVA